MYFAVVCSISLFPLVGTPVLASGFAVERVVPCVKREKMIWDLGESKL